MNYRQEEEEEKKTQICLPGKFYYIPKCTDMCIDTRKKRDSNVI